MHPHTLMVGADGHIYETLSPAMNRNGNDQVWVSPINKPENTFIKNSNDLKLFLDSEKLREGRGNAQLPTKCPACNHVNKTPHVLCIATKDAHGRWCNVSLHIDCPNCGMTARLLSGRTQFYVNGYGNLEILESE
jgi:hypothetical protein